MGLKLHNFSRSSTSTRLRVALNLKGLNYDYIAYSLRDGQTRRPDYLARNPQGLVPMLEREDGSILTQSLAIIEWLDETHPAPALLPPDPDGRARVRALSYMIACETHPLEKGDIFIVPSWVVWSLQAETGLDLLHFSDAPIMERLAFMRSKFEVTN